MLPLQARVDLGPMAVKGYSVFPKRPALLEPLHQIVLCHIQETHWWVFYPSAEMQSVYSTAPTNWASGDLSMLCNTCSAATLNLQDNFYRLEYSKVSSGYKIHRQYLCRGVRPRQINECLCYYTEQSDGEAPVILKFGECGVPFRCHCSLVQSDLEWNHLIVSYLWVK